MSLLEKTVYSGLIFLFSYIILSLILRMFEFTEVYVSHMIGGIVATILGVVAFIILLLYKQKK
jgi:hypothetical protein